jgi:hypothetical protein
MELTDHDVGQEVWPEKTADVVPASMFIERAAM